MYKASDHTKEIYNEMQHLQKAWSNSPSTPKEEPRFARKPYTQKTLKEPKLDSVSAPTPTPAPQPKSVSPVKTSLYLQNGMARELEILDHHLEEALPFASAENMVLIFADKIHAFYEYGAGYLSQFTSTDVSFSEILREKRQNYDAEHPNGALKNRIDDMTMFFKEAKSLCAAGEYNISREKLQESIVISEHILNRHAKDYAYVPFSR
jgi:hypothetical protein